MQTVNRMGSGSPSPSPTIETPTLCYFSLYALYLLKYQAITPVNIMLVCDIHTERRSEEGERSGDKSLTCSQIHLPEMRDEDSSCK